MRSSTRSGGEDAKATPARRLAWWLVYLYPPQFRRDVGLGLVDTLEDRMRFARAHGASLAAVWLRAFVDTVRNAPLEWLRAIRELRLKPHRAVDAGGSEPSAASGFSRPGRSAMDKLMQDVRYALRLWARRPGVALVAIITLALGIGANTAMFSIVNAVLLRPLPYADADRLVALWGKSPTTPRSIISLNEYAALREQRDTFDDVATYLGQSVNLTGVAEPQRIVGNFVSGSFFQVLQLKAEKGRLFDEAESLRDGAKPVVVVSHAFWQSHFAGDPAIVGKAMTLNGSALTVVGVLAAPFDAGSAGVDGWVAYDVFIPMGLFPVPPEVPRTTIDASPSMLALGRLKRGVSVTAANAVLDVVSRRVAAADPQQQHGRAMFAVAAHEDLVGNASTPLMLLLSSVSCVLLIACLNISNLMLARAVDRQREIALRAALGASRMAVARQLVLEAAVLAVVSTSLGLFIGRWAVRALLAIAPAGVSLPPVIPLDARVLLFTFATAVLCAFVCGLAPAARAVRANLIAGLQGRRTTGGGRVVRDAFVVVQIALCLGLIGVSALLVQSLFAQQSISVGFDTRNVFTLQFRLPATKYKNPETIARFFQQAIANVRAVPGIESAALVRRVPLSNNWGDTPFTPEGKPVAKGAEPRAGQNIVTPDYFRTMKIPLIRGRDFTDRDNLAAPPVVAINDTLARTIWPGEDPIGKRITVPDFKEPAAVIAVVGDVKHRSPTEPASPQLYLAHYQAAYIFSSLVARTAVPPLTLTPEIRRAIWSVDKDQPVWSVSALDTIADGAHGSARFLATLLSIFASVALILAAVGVYGVMSYAVTERTHEIGIRMALGASTGRVTADVLRHGAVLTAVAIAIGVPTALALARLTQGLLFGVGAGDPLTLAGAAALLVVVSLGACYWPARRASRVDPVVALAEE
jgi:putative ABC transport system permease protein